MSICITWQFYYQMKGEMEESHFKEWRFFERNSEGKGEQFIHSNMAAPKVEPAGHLSARDERSFAYKTIKDRLPVILTKVIDLLSRRASEIECHHGIIGREETKQIIGKCSSLFPLLLMKYWQLLETTHVAHLSSNSDGMPSVN